MLFAIQIYHIFSQAISNWFDFFEFKSKSCRVFPAVVLFKFSFSNSKFISVILGSDIGTLDKTVAFGICLIVSKRSFSLSNQVLFTFNQEIEFFSLKITFVQIRA